MWAMIPMFRTRSSAARVATALIVDLPAVVREGLVGLRHSVDVVLLLVGPTLLVERVLELAGQLLGHALLAPVARCLDEPAERERASATLRHLDGHLVVGAANAPGAHLEHGRDALHGLLEHLELGLAGLLGGDGKRVVDDLLGDGLLPVQHQPVDELRHEHGAVNGIRIEPARLDGCAARHLYAFFAPYLERACRRSETPAESSPPRMTL